MVRRNLKLVLVASVATLAIAAPGISIAGAGTIGQVTLCINPHNGVVHFPSSGKCGSGQYTLIAGKGAVGARGTLGVAGPAGPAGPGGGTGVAGPAGPAGGPQGVQGLQGIQGVVGPTGVAGATGAVGGSGIAGTVGGSGAAGVVGGTGIAGPVGGTGAAGGLGGTGPVGGTGPAVVPVFHIIVGTTVSTVTGTATAACPGTQVATGGGYTLAGTTPGATITNTGPQAAGAGWTVAFVANTAGNVTAQAICQVGTETP